MASKRVKWVGPPEALCQALADAGYDLTVEPGKVYELPDDVADSLVESSSDWNPAKGKEADA